MSALVDRQLVCEEDGYIPSEQELTLWAQSALDACDISGELTVRIVKGSESQQLNHDYRGKDKPTNVLSFPFEAPPGIETDLIGDLVVCKSIVEREAGEQNKPLSHHWAHMIVHGCLHLLGYDHIEDDEAEEMESLEIDILANLAIANPYQDLPATE